MTATIPTEAPTLVACAYRWLHRGDAPMAEQQLRRMTPTEMREAYTTLLRTTTILVALMFEHEIATVAVAALTPDALPEHVEGYPIGGRR